jgi:hypothetical protein
MRSPATEISAAATSAANTADGKSMEVGFAEDRPMAISTDCSASVGGAHSTSLTLAVAAVVITVRSDL